MSDNSGLPTSVGAMLRRQAEINPNRIAYQYPDADENWQNLTWEQTWLRVKDLAAGLLSFGIGSEDRVAIAASCRLEWVLADHANMCAGAATTTIFPTTTADEVAFILTDSESKIVFAEDAVQVEKIIGSREQLPNLIKIIQIDGEPAPSADDLVISWKQLEAAGKAYLVDNPGRVEAAIAATNPEHLATVIYTSGTTGRPKGVRLVHANWIYEGTIPELINLASADDVMYLWLPLSHVFGKCLLAMGVHCGFATAVDGRVDKIVEGLGKVKPTFMAGAPRIFEKVRAKVILSAAHGLKAKIFKWAFNVGHKTVPLRLRGEQPSGLLAAQYRLADKLVFSKLKDRMGGNIRFFVSGSAPLSREVQEWFYAAGLVILEGYGLTESSASWSVNRLESPKFGTVGPPHPGAEVKIADDGEILIKSAGIMRGYHNNPEATAEAFDDEGFLRTGDIGELVDGYLKITDRKKDLIKTSGGKYVAPQKVEAYIKTASPYLSQVIVHGDGRKYVSAMVELDPDAISEWAQENDLGGASYADLTAAPQVRALLQTAIDDANSKLERWETVKRFAILPSTLSVDAGDITPSMKVKRRAVERRYAELLETLYDQD